MGSPSSSSNFTNFEVLASRFPSVAAQLKNVVAAGYTPTAPELSAMWAQLQVKKVMSNTLYLVSGLGEHVEALLPRVDATACVVVYEASAARLRAGLEATDWSVVLRDPRVHLFAGQVSTSEFERLHQLPVVRVGEVVPLRFSPIWQTAEKSYSDFFSEFARQFEVVRRLHLTNFHDSFFWQATTLENIPAHTCAPDIGVLKGAFPQMPLVLVGAGPSLDEAEEFLKHAQNRALIVAVNSSYRKLRNIGVKPHLVLAADPRDDTARGFEGQPTTDGTFLVAPFIVNPQVVRAFKGQAFSWSGENNVIVDILRKRLGLSPGTMLLEKGTVSLSVADFALHMGCRRLILVGQDMALGPDGLTHTSDSIYGGHKLQGLESGNSRRVLGNTLPEVVTLNNLYVYLKAFEQWVEGHPQMEVLNTSRLGAKIAGATYLPYAEASRKLSEAPVDIQLLLNEAFEKAPERKIESQAWVEALKPTLKYAQEVYQKALTAVIALENLPPRYFQPAYREHKEVKDIYLAANTINQLLDKNPSDYRILLEGRLKKTLLDFQLAMDTLSYDSAQSQELNTNREFFWALVAGVEPLLGILSAKINKAPEAGATA